MNIFCNHTQDIQIAAGLASLIKTTQTPFGLALGEGHHKDTVHMTIRSISPAINKQS